MNECLTCGYKFSPYEEYNEALVCPECGSGDIMALPEEGEEGELTEEGNQYDWKLTR